MGPYSALIGKRVEIHYRAGDLHLCARGALVAETPRSLFLEERFSRNGKEKLIRIGIPHEFVLRIWACQTHAGTEFRTPVPAK